MKAQPVEVPTFAALRRALATDDMEAIRSALLSLDADGQRALDARLGPDAAQRLFGVVRRVRRGAKRGRVIVIHGIMGAQLDSLADGDPDRVWLNYWRLLRGRIEELGLTIEGKPARPRDKIRVAGMFPEYLPLLTELADQWEVVPFAFDWRLSMDVAATALAERVKSWAKGEPTHIVAHSMGGLVSRRFIRLFPRVWEAMQDTEERGRGGRLIMLGTPNKGSLAIPLVLTGKEKTVRMLEKLDLEHNMEEILDILGSFGGSYEMLPSPELRVDDDRARLFDRAEWGSLPVHEELLKAGRSFQTELDRVIDPGRMIYVAGYDQPTPYRIRIDGPGVFSYQTTSNGDGRVPHELGLLEGVRTFWVKESHGDLARNRAVLAGIHDLLLRGTTTSLEAERPVRRAIEAPTEWQAGEALEQVPSEIFSIIGKPVRRGKTGKKLVPAQADPIDAERYESLILGAYLGTPGGKELRRGVDSAGRGGSGRLSSASARAKSGAKLRVRVVWGDITKATGDVYVSGHYERVTPQHAELALDEVISGVEHSAVRANDDRLVLTNLTRRGILSGALGQVAFFPWAHRKGRVVAIAGMGYPGGFGRTELRRLSRNLTWAVAALPTARTVCTVLIGAGEGNMKVPMSVEGMILGLIEALESMPQSRGIDTLCFVERDYRKAAEIHGALQELATRESVAQKITLAIEDRVERGEGGAMGDSQCLALALGTAIHAARAGGMARNRKALKTLMDMISNDFQFRDLTIQALERAAKAGPPDLLEHALGFRIDLSRPREREGVRQELPPTRLSFVRDGAGICAAAITNTTVVPERRLSFDFELVTEAGVKMTDPEVEEIPGLSSLLTRLIFPREFRELIDGDAPVVFEVDRNMARVHWEMLAKSVSDEDAGAPLSLGCQVARQLRTTYSPPPSVERRRLGAQRALVIGDPGDPKAGESLPGAREEALAVADLLKKKNFDVTVMIGAPSVEREGKLRDIGAASRIDVLSELMKGGYDLLHYAGHGDFDDERPDTVGWVFEGGLITARELERIDLAPRLVVANACLSGLTSERLARGDTVLAGKTEADLLPGLADEFFMRGVRNYIGTAWEVNDLGAVTFATTFYEQLIPDLGAPTANPPTIGQALLAARQRLKEEERKFGALWAAYQHYGDPSQAFLPTDGGGASESGPQKQGATAAARGRQRKASSARTGRERAARVAKSAARKTGKKGTKRREAGSDRSRGPR